MMLCRFGPRRLSPSLVVWQVRHALLNISCPDPASAPARAGSWGTAEDDSRIRNVEQASPTIGIRGMKASKPNVYPATERAVATISSSVCEIAGMLSAIDCTTFRKVNRTKAVFRGSKRKRRDVRKHASCQRTGLRGKFPANRENSAKACQ